MTLLAVCLKAARRTDVAVRTEQSGRGPCHEGTPPGLSPADGSALGLALRLREALPGSARVLALTVGPPAWDSVLRAALGFGADEALRLGYAGAGAEAADGSADTTQARARAAAGLLGNLAPTLVLVGERSGDDGHGCFGACLAHALGAAYARAVTEAQPRDGGWRVLARLERGYTQQLDLRSPAVLAVSAQAPPPSYPALPAWLAGHGAAIAARETAAPPPPRSATTLRPPRPRVKRQAPPPADADAEARIRALLATGGAAGGTVLGVEVGPERQAEAILALLRERG